MDGEVTSEVPEAAAPVYLKILCGNATGDGGLFWDVSGLLDTWQPSLPLCFQTSVWVWWPCLALWLATPLYLAWIRQPPSEKPRPLSGLALLKLALCVMTCAVCVVDVGRRVWQTTCGTCTGLQGSYAYTTSIIQAATFAWVSYLTVHLCRRGIHSSGLLFMFWLTLTFTGAVSLASDLMRPYYKIHDEDLFTFASFCVYYALVVAQFLATLVPDPSVAKQRVVVLEDDDAVTQPMLWHASTSSSESSSPWPKKHAPYKAPCPEDNATFLSKITFFWLTRLLCRGYRRGTLYFEDLEDTPAGEKTGPLVADLRSHWHRYRRNNSPPNVLHLFLALLKTAWRPLVAAGSIRLLICFTTFFNPMLLQVLLSWLESDDQYQWKGYALCVILLAANIFNSIATHVFFKLAGVSALRVRTALTALVYRKSVRLSSSARQAHPVGSVVNLMAVDAQKVHDTVQDMHELWASPIMLALTLAYLWTLLGPSCLAGLAFVLLLAPLNGGFLIRKFAGLQEDQMRHKDERIQLMTEILNNIKVVKMYAWEAVFAGRVEAARRAELDTVRFQAYIQASVGMVWYCTPFLVSLCVFTVYVLSSPNNFLDPQKAFVSINLFNTLNWSTSFIPIFLAHAAQAYISLGRILQLLLEDELDDTAVEYDVVMEPAIRVENASFFWSDKAEEKSEEKVERPITLKSLNFVVPEGTLTAIVGHVGSGKSSLVAALLGEMNKLQGTVQLKGNLAYVPQEPWIQNMSLRQNILFGRPLESAWYHEVLTACALTEDLQQLPSADRTEIGEKGITLSGGQRQRVSLARAVYQKRDIVIMDDTLSALDAHVARHVFDHVIGPQGLLKYKTRLLVTNNLSLLTSADQIIVLEGGGLAEVGTYERLLNRQEAFARLLGDHSAARQRRQDKLSDEDSAVSSSSDADSFLVARTGKRHSKRRTRSAGKVSMEASIQTHLSSMMGSSRQGVPPAALVKEEAAQEGTITWSVLRRYLSSGGWLSGLAVLAFQLVYVASLAATNIWLGVWADDPTDDMERARTQTRYRLSVYSVLGIGQMLSVGVLSLAVYLGCLRASRLLHTDLLWRVLRAPLVIFHTTPMGRILNRFSVDIDKLDASMPLFTRLWLFNVAAVLSTFLIIVYSTPVFIVAIIPIAIVYVIIQRVYIVSIRQLKRIDLIRRSPIFVHFNESLVGATCVRAFQREQQFILEADNLIDSSNMAWYPILIGQRWLGFLLDLLGTLIVFFAALFAVLQSRDAVTSGLAGLAVSFAMQISWSINMMVRGSAELETHVVSVERIIEYSELPQEPAWKSPDYQPPPLWPDRGEVVFRNYSATYRLQLPPVLRQVSLRVNPGEKLAVVGRTGAGKSSLALAIFRLIHPLGGALYLDGIDVATVGLHDLRGRVTIIPQEPSIFKGTLRWNLDPSDGCATGELWQALEQVHLKDYVTSLAEGLEHECGEGGQNLSSGQRQLVCLARALLRRSRVLVLDEVTASVDPETDALIQIMLRTQLRNLTVITIAHRLSTVRHYDRVCVMDDGCILELDTPDALLQKEGSVFRALAQDAM